MSSALTANKLYSNFAILEGRRRQYKKLQGQSDAQLIVLD